MLFNSYFFLFVFLPVCVMGFFLIGARSNRWACFWLVGASLIFYGYWKWKFVWYLLASIAFNFYLGTRITSSLNNRPNPIAKYLLVLGIAANLLLLTYFKYGAFLVEQLHALFGFNLHPGNTTLPIGISFFTFTQIAFLVDCYRGLARDKDPVRYALFVSYFPHLVAGPLLHHAQVMPQFQQAKNFIFRNKNLEIGLSVFAIGLFKKAVLADGVAPYANAVFDLSTADSALTFFDSWLGATAYSLQLYFDFSGYSDMAIGLSRIFGISIPANFASPYKAKNIIDFWRRWHISLSRFLRNYLYIPLGGNRHGKVRRYMNLMITMLLGGLWHGAGWTFVIWGGLHGIYLAANHLFRTSFRLRSASEQTWIGSACNWALTFTAVVVAWVPFRSKDVSSALHMLGAMFGLNGVTFSGQFANGLADWNVGFVWVTSLLILCLTMPNTLQIMSRYRIAQIDSEFLKPNNSYFSILRWRMSLRWSLVTGAILCAGLIGIGIHEKSPFLYFQF